MEFDINSGEWFIANLAMVGLGGKDVTNENDASNILAMGFHDDEERKFIFFILSYFI